MIKKSIIAIFFLIACFAFLNGCKKEESDKEILESFLNATFKEGELNEDLNLANTYNFKEKTIKCEFESSDEEILTPSGKLYFQIEDMEVSLKVKATLNNDTVIKDYTYYVYGDEEKAFLEAYKALNIPSSIDRSLDLKSSIRYGKSNFRLSYTSSDQNALKNDGKIVFDLEDKDITLTVNLYSNRIQKTFEHNLKVLKIDTGEVLNKLIEIGTSFEGDITDDISLLEKIDYKGEELDLTWVSKNQSVLSNDGIISPDNKDTIVQLTVKTIFNITKTYNLSIKAMSDEMALNKAIKEISIPSLITSDINLNLAYSYNTSATWQSSDINVIKNDGTIVKTNTEFKNVTLKLTLSKGDATMEKDFNVKVSYQPHFFSDRTFYGTKEDVHIENGKIVLDEGKSEGYYETGEIAQNNILSCVGSFVAKTSKTATCELLVRIKSNNKWSKYFSYGKWGQGLNNACLAQSDTYVKMVEDEIKLISSNKGNAFQMKIILRRSNVNYESPILSMLALAIEIADYSYDVDISNLPKEVKYDVPKLYQHEVPKIGGIICSATSSTMLLKYKGHDFSDKAAYEHEYIASIVYDSGNDIYGNWAYNTIAMGSFDEVAYVKRFGSVNEFIQHLALVGPVAASIKGLTITNKKTYNTAGHLLVVTGYKIEDSGTTIYINDPNVVGVEVEMTLENFLNVYRMVSYIVE